jgi:hypothetical protein
VSKVGKAIIIGYGKPKRSKKFLLKKSYEWNVDDQVAFAKSVITQCLSELDGTVYSLPKATKQKALDILDIKNVDHGNGHNCSRAGRDKLMINLQYWQACNVINAIDEGKPKVWYKEYNSFDKDPEIGGFYIKAGDVQTTVLIQVLHELAHFIQFNLWHSDRQRWKYMRSPHGEGFRAIYKVLRKKYFNDPTVRQNFINDHLLDVHIAEIFGKDANDHREPLRPLGCKCDDCLDLFEHDLAINKLDEGE